jgi:hypothetical protein
MRVRPYCFAIAAWSLLTSGIACAQTVNNNPTYSSAVHQHQDPHDYLVAIEALER